ncbi:haspin isoform X1 [Bombus fervidus]|uniref:haspin isoform X1 n=1 Tax=Bombus fervidus TaxID=203811 RepID=UPI003AB27F22
MNQRVNKCIRTYERKKFKEAVVPVPKMVISSSDNMKSRNRVLLNDNSNIIEEKDADNDSMYNDPFETTFDRLIKNARILPPMPKAHNDTTLLTSSDSKSEINDHQSSLYKTLNFDTEPVFKTTRRKIKEHITKKTISKKNVSVLKDNGESKVQEDISHKKYKLRKTRNNSKMPFKYSYIKQSKKNYNKKYFVKNSEKACNIQSDKSCNSVEIKPCFINLDRSAVSKWNSKLHTIENNLLKENDQLLDQHSISGISIDNLKHEAKIKHCTIKLEQLGTNPYIAPLDLRKKCENVFSSTPNGKPVRSNAHLISLSPIPVKYFEKLKDSTMLSSNISFNENNEILLKSKLISDDLYKETNIIKKYKDEHKSSSYLANTSNFSKYNFDQFENIDKKDIDSLIKLSYSENCDQKEFLTKRDSVQNVPRNRIEKNNISNKSVLTEELISNVKIDKHILRFSNDANMSRSLFDDTNGSIQTPLGNDIGVNDVVKISINNLVTNEKSTVLNNERHSDFVKLNKTSTANINTDKKVTFDKSQEELPATSVPIKLTKSDSSSDDKNNDIANVDGKILSSRDSVLSINHSSVDSSIKCGESHVVLKQLQDSIRVTKRKKYTKWDLDLVNITEDCDNSTELKKKQIHLEKTNTEREMILSRKELSVLENITEECTNNVHRVVGEPVYLKPGKSWIRSLSILHNLQTEFNLDKLSVGKGKKWRYSVQDILNMQTQGIIQSCIKKNDSNTKLRTTNEVINKSKYELINNKGKTCDSTNLTRVSKRISVRVVPIHETVKSIEDASFLEVYGIVPVKSQRFTLLNNPQKSSICNIQNNDSDIQVTEEHVVSTAREVILQRCLQKDYIPFTTYFSDSYLEHCRKIGEGVYGEVFLYEQENKKSVIKIIPIEGSDCVNGEPQKKFHEILSEIVIAIELHNLRFNTRYNTDGFVEVKDIKCIKGKYPERLIELWNIYDEEKHSDNDCPSMFNDDQLYIVLELGHGGQDLEAFVFNTAEEAHILFIQAALALAVAEKAIEFEHRDLHWGNILISSANEDYVHYKIGQKNIELISKGVKVSIIDFTLSRVKYQGCSVFNDLASDPTLFTAQGEYQFEIYRLMRDKVKNNWQAFEPYTNILWLHYTLDKMITAVRYKKKNLKIHKNGITKLKELENEILTYNSAFDFVTNCDKIVNLLRINSKSEVTSV